jgi:hypothetical protein
MSITHYKRTRIWLNLHVLFVAVFFGKKPKRELTLNAMLSKVQFTFKVNSIDSLQGIEIEIHG